MNLESVHKEQGGTDGKMEITQDDTLGMVPQDEWEKEKLRLKHVRAQIDLQIKDAEMLVKDRNTSLIDFRRHFWDEISITDESDPDHFETRVSVIQQAQIMKSHEHSLKYAHLHLQRLEKQASSPYFSRIDFIEGCSPEKTSYYFGIHTIVDESTEELLVCDWRAPIAELFYDYEIGPATYEAPEGQVLGEIVLKRQYRIERGELIDMFNTGVHIVDHILQQMLGKNANAKMKSIVMTIQKEQNRIIREDRFPLLIVQGTAGSGKTSVALQRVAYLLYKYRASLEADQVVLFSPNQLFNDYVSTVLPELGEQNMLQTTFQQYIEHRLDLDMVLEDAYAQLESLLSEQDDLVVKKRLQWIRFKGSSQFLNIIDQYIMLLATEGLPFTDYVVREQIVFSKEELMRRFYSSHTSQPISRRIHKFQEWIKDELVDKRKKWTRDYYYELLKVPQYIGTEEELKSRSRKRMKKEFARLANLTDNARFIDIIGAYCNLFTDSSLYSRVFDLCGMQVPDGWEEMGAMTVEYMMGQKNVIPYEDGIPLFYLREKLEGVQQFHRIRHVVIDEAQDYTPFQLTMIKSMFPRSKVTMLGDLNQGILPASQDSYSFASDLWGEERSMMFSLQRSYRSTTEIVDWTRQILPNASSIEAFARHGDAPKMVKAASNGEKVNLIANRISQLLDERMNSIAVLCKTEQESQRAFEQLSAHHPKLTLLHKHMKTYTGGLLVIPAYLAKGLEFDAVLIFDASADIYYREHERKLFYTACTRAMHDLTVYYVDQLTPFIVD